MLSALGKLLSLVIDIGLIIYCGYLGVFKKEPTMSDVAFIAFITMVFVLEKSGKNLGE